MESSRLHSDTPSALPAGTRLGEFELLSLLGVGGFGIVYLAFDHALEREVAVKEYMPASLAGRTETMHVSLRSQSDAETFALGLKSFVNEGRLLARFDHPSLLKVHRFWEANGTAYMAMPVMRGRTVRDIRLAMKGPPDEAWLRALLEPLLGAIERLHSEGVYHRDIAPDNIQIEPDGHPVLLDFGAARRVISDKSQTLTAILKPAYAPIEQYAEAGSVKQGPWTDIYALGATLHFLLLARPPSPATARAVHDDASQLTMLAVPGCSQNFLHIVDWMLAPRPADRPQNVAAVRAALEGRTLPPQRRVVEPASEWDRTVIVPQPGPYNDEATLVMPPPGARHQSPPAHTQPSQAPPPAGPTTTVRSLPDPLSDPLIAPPAQAPHSAPSSASQPAPAASRSRLLPIGLGVAVLLIAGAAVALWPRQQLAPAVALPAAAAPAAVAAVAAEVPPPAASVPESAITTVEVPSKPAAPAALPGTAPAPAAGTARPPATAGNSAGTTPPRAGDRPAAGTRPAQGVAAAPAPAPVVAPAAADTRPATPAAGYGAGQGATAAPAPASTTPANAANAANDARKPVPTGPEATCGGRNPLLYFVCMERECLRSELSGHADCLKWRKDAKRD